MCDELHLVLKHIWFEKIKSGQKTSEYRECKDYWNKKFNPIVNGEKEMWKYVIFNNGYTYKTIKFKLLSIAITNEPNDLHLPKVWELKFEK